MITLHFYILEMDFDFHLVNLLMQQNGPIRTRKTRKKKKQCF